MEKRLRPMTKAEINEMKLTSARTYLVQLDAFIHRLRQEVGLSTGEAPTYLSPPMSEQDTKAPRKKIWQIFTRHSPRRLWRRCPGASPKKPRLYSGALSPPARQPGRKRRRREAVLASRFNPIGLDRETTRHQPTVHGSLRDTRPTSGFPGGSTARGDQTSSAPLHSRANAANHCEGRRRGCRHLTGESRRSV